MSNPESPETSSVRTIYLVRDPAAAHDILYASESPRDAVEWADTHGQPCRVYELPVYSGLPGAQQWVADIHWPKVEPGSVWTKDGFEDFRTMVVKKIEDGVVYYIDYYEAADGSPPYARRVYHEIASLGQWEDSIAKGELKEVDRGSKDLRDQGQGDFYPDTSGEDELGDRGGQVPPG